MKNFALGFAFLLVASATALGCSSTREVALTGEAKSAASIAGPITIEVFDSAGGDDAEEVSVGTIELATLGPFEKTVEVEGDEIRLFALFDADQSGACSAGDAWAEAKVAVDEDGNAAPVTLELAAAACPAAQPAD